MSSSEFNECPFKLGQVIGRGTYGNVYVAKLTNTSPGICAVKTVTMEDVPDDIWHIVRSETCQSKEFQHNSLLKMTSTYLCGFILYKVMPLMVYQSCDKIIEKYFPYGFPEPAIGMILRDVLGALDYLHSLNYIHRAVKGSHILIKENGTAVLSSFRFMQKLPPNTKTIFNFNRLNLMKKNLNWLSPELLQQDNHGYSYTSDIYSLGITACELANGVVPYAEMNPSLMLVKKLRDKPPAVWDRKYFMSEGHSSCSPLPIVPRQPVQHLTSRPQSAPSTSTTDSEDEITFGHSTVEEMNRVYMEKAFSKDFQDFLLLTLCVDRKARISSSGALKLKFIKCYKNHVNTELLKCLNLTNPVQFTEDQLDQELDAAASSVHKLTDEVMWDFDKAI